MTMGLADKGDSGFTLVELLVVLAILGLLTGLITTTLHSAAQGLNHVVRSDFDSEETQSTEFYLRRLIEQIYPARTGDPGKTVVRFAGNPTRLEFLAPLPKRFGRADIAICHIAFKSDGSLHISWQLDRASPQARIIAEDRIEGFSDVSFSFYGKASEDEPPIWSTFWRDRERLPLLIRVRFQKRGNEATFLFAPMIDATPCLVGGPQANCTY